MLARIIIGFIGFICFYGISLFYIADTGLLAYKELSNYKSILEKNRYYLELHNKKLLQEYLALKNDSEIIEEKAQNLGYYPNNSLILDFPVFKKNNYYLNIGDIPLKKPYASNTKAIPFIWGTLGFMLFFMIDFIWEFLQEKRKKKNFYTEKIKPINNDNLWELKKGK